MTTYRLLTRVSSREPGPWNVRLETSDRAEAERMLQLLYEEDGIDIEWITDVSVRHRVKEGRQG